MSRTYQSVNTRFNIFFNGTESFRQGLDRINQSHTDDYAEILPMFPISFHENHSAGLGDMIRAQEKAEEAIRTRSIRQRPQRNARRARNSPRHQAFLNRTEFNTMIDDCWLLMGKAQFYQTDFIGAVATFIYIARHFTFEEETVAKAQIWLARSYAEMGWFHEAEETLNRINQNGFSRRQNTFFAAISADLLLKQNRHNEAIPFLELAINGERDRRQRARFEFILGQIHEQRGDRERAYEMFTSVIRSNPPFEMALNARLRQAENHVGSDKDDLLRRLDRMTRNSNNFDHLDQIYAAIGNIFLQKGDTIRAIENYKLSIEKSTRRGYDKARTHILLADLYYSMENYLAAQPHYAEAARLMNAQSSDFRRVVHLADVLSDLNRNVEIVTLQDSLQRLSNLPEREQLVAIREIIERVIREEEEAQQRAEEERLLAERMFGAGGHGRGMNMNVPLGDHGAGTFYFYNPQLVAAGRAEFIRRWGNRRLEDNWRRQVRTVAPLDGFAMINEEAVDEFAEDMEDADPDDPANNNRRPEFYLRQLFTTPEQFAASDMAIMYALHEIGFIYSDRINNMRRAVETFEELDRRFPMFEQLPEVFFFLYQTHARQGKTEQAAIHRQRLIERFPDHRYARILSQPDYENLLRRMVLEQDALYEQTYYAYLANDFQTVFRNVSYMERNFPASPLMPQFVLLNALSIAKTDTPENFRIALEELVERFPETYVTPFARGMLALFAQGQESHVGETHGNLITLREQEMGVEARNEDVSFENDESDTHFFVLAVPIDRPIDMNALLFNVAIHNFTKFLVRDFDIEIRQFNNDNLLIVRNLEGLEEALWYQSGVEADSNLASKIRNNAITSFVVSRNNFNLIYSVFSLEEYFDFYNSNIAIRNNRRPIVNRMNEQVIVAVPPQQVVQQQAATRQVTAAPAELVAEVPPTVTQPAELVAEQVQEVVQEAPQVAVATPRPELPRFRGLYTFDETAQHYFAIYILDGNFDFDRVRTALNRHNAEYYPQMNKQVTLANSGRNRVILVGMLPDATTATAYLRRIVRYREIFEGMQSATFRNFVITEENLQTLNQVGNPTVYLEFLREVYLR